jgi:hypothetical protein
MKIQHLLVLSCLALSASFVRAEPIKLANRQADELLGALSSIESGLTAVNTTLVADNIIELRPKVEAFAKGNAAAQKRFNITATTKNDTDDAGKFLAEIEANRDREITVDLQRLTLSDEEITAAKIRPSVLAVIRQFLKPVPAKK